MTNLIVILQALLCVSVLTQGKSVVIIEVAESKPMDYYMKNITMHPDDTCSIQTPLRAEPYNLHPTADVLPASLGYFNPDPSLPNTVCGFRIKAAAASDAGKWSLTLNSTGGDTDHVSVTEDLTVRVVVTTRDVVPEEILHIVQGHDMYLRFEKSALSNLVECRVNWTSGGDVVLRPGITVDPVVAYWGSGLKDECGVKATGIEMKDAGVWKLLATNTTSHVISGEFTVDVLNTTTIVENEEIFIEQGYETLSLGASGSTYCQIRLPNGTLGVPVIGKCSVKLNSVTKASEGTWGATFGVLGQLEEMQTTSSVQVMPVDSIYTSLTPSTRIGLNGALDLLCRWTTYRYTNTRAYFCRFTRPDGIAMSLQDGVGNAEYSYYGDGLNFSPNIKYCGVTIINPRAEDLGTWQCVIGGNLSQLKSGFINVPPTTRGLQANSTKRETITVTGGEVEVNVKNGTSLTISCRATVSLTYCWFGHPNGSVITPVTNKVDKAFYYSGKGLAFGECSLTLAKSVLTDSGVWTCNMGVQGLADMQVQVTARVSDSIMVARYPKVELRGSNSISVICQSVPHGIALQYCRFVRPDGVGFGFTTNHDLVMERYAYDGAGLEFGECGVRISPVSSEDFGKWQCAALNFISSTSSGSAEGIASFDLADARELTGGAVTGIVIGSIVAALLIAAGIFFLYKRNRK